MCCRRIRRKTPWLSRTRYSETTFAPTDSGSFPAGEVSRRIDNLFDVTALRLRYREDEHEGDDQTGDTGSEKRIAPSEVLLDPTADKKGEQQSDIQTCCVERQRAGAFLRFVKIRNDRINSLRGSCLAYSGSDAR